ncbi:hypothetical protein [Treponema saccharophilum]|nr:hypothetical protein [Treponema saccharophilum]
MRSLLRVFRCPRNGADVLVLGAFGCGAFRNNPDVVAKDMVSLAKKYALAFKVIEFAVFCRGFDDVNYSAFESEFGRQGIGC